MTRPTAVLFLCTHNSARSILAEAILNNLGGDRFVAYSAGSTPRDQSQPNPLTLTVLREQGINVAGLRSKSWDEFLGEQAPPIDLVVTVCGNANEVCPLFPGTPPKIHWGYSDPSAGDAPDDVKLDAFRKTFQMIHRRIAALVSLPDASLTNVTLVQSARNLAEIY
jgi:protein-tyrosine-phosphatase